MISRRSPFSRTSSRVRLTVVTALVCTVGMTGALAPVAAQPGGSGGSDDIDALTATRDELRAELADLEQRYDDQRTRVEQARQATRDAETAARAASERVERAKGRLETARKVVAGYAVEAYMRPPAADTLRVLSLSRADDAGFAHSVMEIMTEDRQQVVDDLVVQQEVVARERAAAERAAEAARRSASDAELELVELDQMRVEQQDLAATMDERLDDALAEAAALAAVDQAAADQLYAEEVALRGEGPAASTRSDNDVGVVGQPVAAPPSTTSPGGGGGAPSGPAPSTPRPTTPRPPVTGPPATSPPRPPSTPSTGVTWSDVTNVGGIYVNKSIATNVRNLLNAATSAGLSLRGGGYRDPAGQIATRRANCGPTYYDIYQKPSGQCSPPTALPGRSMHERGLAIDFTSSGALIRSRSDPAFIWLRGNAARFGLFNLPSEPWHWSTTGG